MKKYLIFVIILFIMSGCTAKESINSNVKSVTDSNNAAKLEKENTELKELVKKLPNVTNEQLVETMNLSLKSINAMVEKDYAYLQSVVDSSITIDKTTNSFVYKDGFKQDFIKTINHKVFDYRFHSLNKDGRIIVGFAENNVEYEFKFKQINGKMLLISFLTN
ncbi:hypothetical protein [Neobacillus sp. PS3-40]|uniref:hypothetical protein n=1 Tax=Neobacillus sp. PS3-40 TaxID=3070679 RepID=UPI0027E005E6|nr:hypothetical protein [Neobacillus sp. PS3-40]WML45973.1 hypothetical protein RCG20_08855 [Neobacillus sp. PS3-40]